MFDLSPGGSRIRARLWPRGRRVGADCAGGDPRSRPAGHAGPDPAGRHRVSRDHCCGGPAWQVTWPLTTSRSPPPRPPRCCQCWRAAATAAETCPSATPRAGRSGWRAGCARRSARAAVGVRRPGHGPPARLVSAPGTAPKDDSLPKPVAAELRAHRARQNRERLAASNIWQDHDMVFAQENGRPGRPACRLGGMVEHPCRNGHRARENARDAALGRDDRAGRGHRARRRAGPAGALRHPGDARLHARLVGTGGGRRRARRPGPFRANCYRNCYQAPEGAIMKPSVSAG